MLVRCKVRTHLEKIDKDTFRGHGAKGCHRIERVLVEGYYDESQDES